MLVHCYARKFSCISKHPAKKKYTYRSVELQTWETPTHHPIENHKDPTHQTGTPPSQPLPPPLLTTPSQPQLPPPLTTPRQHCHTGNHHTQATKYHHRYTPPPSTHCNHWHSTHRSHPLPRPPLTTPQPNTTINITHHPSQPLPPSRLTTLACYDLRRNNRTHPQQQPMTNHHPKKLENPMKRW